MTRDKSPEAETDFLATCQADYTQVFRQPLPQNPSSEFLSAIRTTAMISSATFRVMHERAVIATAIKVCRSAAGYYLGTFGPEGPISRESEEYWHEEDAASAALDNGDWTPRSSTAQSLQQLTFAFARANARLAEIVALQEPQPPRPKAGPVARLRPKGVQQ